MRIAVLLKQVPAPDQELALVDGCMDRRGLRLELNAYCRRAAAKAVELAGTSGETVAFTMGPPEAEDALREAIACGMTRGVHLCDPAFAGADTLATARALAAAVTDSGPFDLVLCGLNSLDADTGQVGPQVAALLGLPFVGGARNLTVEPASGAVWARCEVDEGYVTVEGLLPAVVSTAERLCDPAKAPPEARAAVEAGRLRCVPAAQLGLKCDEVGASGSATQVGEARLLDVPRAIHMAASAAEAVASLRRLGALEAIARHEPSMTVPETGGAGPPVWCVLGLTSPAGGSELLGEAAALAAATGGAVTALLPAGAAGELGGCERLSRAGADALRLLPGDEPESWADVVTPMARAERPHVLLVEGSQAGRVLAATVAARNGWGLTGDAVALEQYGDGRLVAWKPAFGGRLVAPVTTSSPVQMATVRPGVLPVRHPRPARPVPEQRIRREPGRLPRFRGVARERVDAGAADLCAAAVVIGVGRGVEPADYTALAPLQDALGGAALAATRKVTDAGWLPRSRQVGITGHSLGPRLYVSIGASGRFNHAVGFRSAGTVLALNLDPDAEVFDHADVGLVGDWRVLVPDLVASLRSCP